MIEYKPKKLEILVDGYWRPVYKIVLDEVGFMNRDLIMTDFRYIEEVPEVAEIEPLDLQTTLHEQYTPLAYVSKINELVGAVNQLLEEKA